MPATQAQREASRINGSRSKGPTTTEGKAVSRANAFKHGLTGAGIVLPDSDFEEVERRAGKLVAELRPSTVMGEVFVRRLAVLSVRLTRCDEQASDVVSERVNQALRQFEAARLDEADRLFDALADDPSVTVRKLLRTEQGVRRLIDAWSDLKADLANDRWKSSHGLRLAHLKGYRPDDCGVSFLLDLSETLQARTDQGTSVDALARFSTAKEQLTPLIDAEIEALAARIATLDPAEYELDRAEAIARAKLDAAPDVQQIQKYEAATERSLFRTLKEARLVELAPSLIEQAQPRGSKASSATQSSDKTSAPSGSFSRSAVAPQPVPPEEDNSPLTPEERAELVELLAARGIPSPYYQPLFSENGSSVRSG